MRRKKKKGNKKQRKEDKLYSIFQGGYHFSGEPEKIFYKYFGSHDPYVILNDKSREDLKKILGNTLDN